MFKIVTSISKDQRQQLYTLLQKFEYECNYKNSTNKLPAKTNTNILKLLINKFRERIIELKGSNSRKLADDILDGKKEKSKLFMLCQDEKIIGFEMAQISEEKPDRIVGWKPWLYVQEEFRNTKQDFINEQGDILNRNVTLQLDRNVEDWFSENNVNYQKTSTGVNMIPNIISYIWLGFRPVSKNDKTVFLEKDMRNPLSKQEINKLIKNVKEGNINTGEITFTEKIWANLSYEKQKINADKLNLKQNIQNTNIKNKQQDIDR